MAVLNIIFIIVFVAADRITKYLAVVNLKPIGTASFLPGFIRWIYVENTGMAFSFLQGKRWLLVILTSIALLIVLYLVFFYKGIKKFDKFCLAMVFSGGVGNLIDRIVNGFVVDFADFEFMNFAVFNVADIFVVIGISMLFISIITSEIKLAKAKKAVIVTENQASINEDTDGEKNIDEPSGGKDGKN